MRLLSWNVNGIRAILRRKIDGMSFLEFVAQYDIVAVSETKIDEHIIDDHKESFTPVGYYIYNAHASKRGYSGVSIITKVKPIRQIEPPFNDDEGRLVILEFEQFILIGVYVPNAGQKSAETKLPRRLDYRTREWDPQFQLLCANLSKQKPIIVLGDMNVAATELDIHNPTQNAKHAGFTNAERHNFSLLLEGTPLIDIWRHRHPDQRQYTYFDYRTKARKRNAGWRIDYALISPELQSHIRECSILSNVEGSDHVPLELIYRAVLTD